MGPPEIIIKEIITEMLLLILRVKQGIMAVLL